MKLLLISVKSPSPTGGIAVWTEHFLSHCKNRGIHCHLVNTEVIGKRTHTIKRNLWDELVRTIRIVRGVRKEINNTSFDAVYLNTSCGTYGLFRDTILAYFISKKNIPLITHYHCDIPYWVKRKSSIYCLGRLSAMSQTNLVLCQNSQDFLKTHYNCPSHNVPNFVESAFIRKDAKPISKSIKNIVFVGQVTETKGAMELYTIARTLPDVTFTLVGSISSAMQKEPKPNNVVLTGVVPKEHIATYLDNADLFLLPSHTEGCSMALMEAMARGVPSIATDTGANAEMLSDGCGILVECHNVDAMIEAIYQLANPHIRQSMAVNTIDRIKSNYTEKNVSALLQYIRKEKCK